VGEREKKEKKSEKIPAAAQKIYEE